MLNRSTIEIFDGGFVEFVSGPRGSGKTTLANEWKDEDPKNRVVMEDEEGTGRFSKKAIRRALAAGKQVMLTSLLDIPHVS